MVIIKNKWYEKDDKTIVLLLKRRNGDIFETEIDKEDFKRVEDYNVSWIAIYNKKTKSYYAQASKYLGIIDGKPKYKTLFLHKEIMECYDDGMMVDHISHKTLDNHKENLVIVTNQQNAINRRGKNSNNKSGYRNVAWIKNRWNVQMQVDGKNTLLGKFKYDQLEEAGKFAEEMRKKYYKPIYENAN